MLLLQIIFHNGYKNKCMRRSKTTKNSYSYIYEILFSIVRFSHWVSMTLHSGC
jgi:hypothetical protein